MCPTNVVVTTLTKPVKSGSYVAGPAGGTLRNWLKLLEDRNVVRLLLRAGGPLAHRPERLEGHRVPGRLDRFVRLLHLAVPFELEGEVVDRVLRPAELERRGADH